MLNDLSEKYELSHPFAPDYSSRSTETTSEAGKYGNDKEEGA